MKPTTQTQEEAVLRHLQAGHELTPLEALRLFGCFRLGARIFNLKKQGHKIKSELRTFDGGKRAAVYSLEKEAA